MIQLLVTRVSDVRPHGDNLSIVTVDGHEVVANRMEDGSFRWAAGEVCVYVPENTILPDEVLKERGYWDEMKNKGLLGGSKGNRVKMQRFAGHESRGLLFKIASGTMRQGDPRKISRQVRNGAPLPEGIPALWLDVGDDSYLVEIGDNVAEYVGAEEFVPQ